MKALILDGKVVDLAHAEFDVHESMEWVDAHDEVKHGWSYDGASFTAPSAPPAPTYAELRAAEYPPIPEQLDALWKGGNEASSMKEKVNAVKAKYPKA